MKVYITFTADHEVITVDSLYACDVIGREFDIGMVALVPRIHDRALYPGVLQTEAVTEFVDCHPVEVDSVFFAGCERFIVIEVSVS